MPVTRIAIPALLLVLAIPALAQPLSEPQLRAPAEVMGDRPTTRPADERPNREPNPTRLQPEPPNSAARNTTQPGATPESGQTALTEAQARARFEQAGFAEIGGLTLEAGGTWRASGRRDGRAQRLGLDQRGTISAE